VTLFWQDQDSSLDLLNGSSNKYAFSVHLLSRNVLAGRLINDLLEDARYFLLLPPAQEQETENDSDPVQVVGNDGAVRRAVLPSEKRVEDAPAAVAVLERRAALRKVSIIIAE
jgi:hypothetical protein